MGVNQNLYFYIIQHKFYILLVWYSNCLLIKKIVLPLRTFWQAGLLKVKYLYVKHF